jgi:hypothetical protein
MGAKPGEKIILGIFFLQEKIWTVSSDQARTPFD